MNEKLPNDDYEEVWFESVTALVLSQTDSKDMHIRVFRQALEMLKIRTRHWTYNSVLEVLFYGRKMFSQYLINFEDDNIDGFTLIDQFVGFFNAQCLPWIRNHGGWVSD